MYSSGAGGEGSELPRDNGQLPGFGPVLAPVKAGSVGSARAAAFARCDLGGDHPPGDRLAAPQLPEPRRGPDDHAETTGAGIPAVAGVDSGELIGAPPPQVLLMHDASDGSQVRSCPLEPSRGTSGKRSLIVMPAAAPPVTRAECAAAGAELYLTGGGIGGRRPAARRGPRAAPRLPEHRHPQGALPHRGQEDNRPGDHRAA